MITVTFLHNINNNNTNNSFTYAKIVINNLRKKSIQDYIIKNLEIIQFDINLFRYKTSNINKI